MSDPQPIAQVCADIAWNAYELHSQRVRHYRAGENMYLFDDSAARAREWLGIAVACDRAACDRGGQ